ncbi:membrane protein insertion efficiency factor YidD [Massilia violaceinigra]|nr:membrane protein insertion efficiency factor YidD [Massilia violaceinigra]
MMKTLALSAIGFYQRHLSPYKGFRCAYCAYTGNASCSHLGARAIRRFGLWDGLAILNGRLRKCGIAYRRYQPTVEQPAMARLLARPNQAGECDLPCDCDPSPLTAGKACDCLTGCGDGVHCCDGWNKRRQRNREDSTHIPPRRDGRRRT